MSGPPGFFDVDDRLKRLSHLGDHLEALGKAADVEMLRDDRDGRAPGATLRQGCGRRRRNASTGLPSLDFAANLSQELGMVEEDTHIVSRSAGISTAGCRDVDHAS